MVMSRRISFLVSLAVLQLFLVGYLDFASGYEVSLAIFYFLPIAFAAWYLGAVWSLFFAFAAAATLTWTEVAGGRQFSRTWMMWEHGLMRVLIFGFVAYSFSHFRRTIERERAKLRRLEGLLTFCNYCTRVRDESGNWTELAVLVRNSDVLQTRLKVCPECSRAAYAGQRGAENSNVAQTAERAR